MTNDYVVQMLPMVAIAGALVAWLAQIPKTNRGYGFLADMALGIAGSVGAGALVSKAVTGDGGMIVMFCVGIVGAIVVLAAQRRMWSAVVAEV